MAGGLLNLIALGNQNIILNGNPTKSFFKSSYVKYTNFGLQRFRVDQQGQTTLSLAQETIHTFKIPRYGDLLMDSFLVITLPTIWSPILRYVISNTNKTEFRPYEFEWIKNIGTQIIKLISINIGGRLVQQFSGHFIQNMVERDFDANKKAIFNLMTGNIKELNNPANFSNRKNNYPNAYKIDDTDMTNTVEPSIHSNQLFIPINTWFSMTSAMAIPLICLQYAELDIVFNLRPLYELFTIKDVLYDVVGNPKKLNITSYDDIPRIQASQNMSEIYGWHRFIQPPPYRDISCSVTNAQVTRLTSYPNQSPNLTPQTDIHLITTQCFLDNDERILFAGNEQIYLFKMIYEYNYQRITKTSKVVVESNGLVASWMWFMQRDDVKTRNEWSNYTNWAYEEVFPNNLLKLVNTSTSTQNYYSLNNLYSVGDLSKNIYITGNSPTVYQAQNNRLIMKDFAILCDGKYRENSLPAGVYNQIEKYSRSKGSADKEGLNCYNFAFDTDPFKYQPTGAFNTNKFKTIEFEYNNYANPPIDLSAVNFQVICDPTTNQVIAVSKDPTSIYSYNYNLHIYEERYNVLIFQSGMVELLYSR